MRGQRIFSEDVSVSKKSEMLGIPAGFQIVSDKKNEDKTKWRGMQSWRTRLQVNSLLSGKFTTIGFL